MSDQKLRDLERRWKETGAVEDEAAYLLERVRVGDLTQERLELAAKWGCAAAQHCVESGGELPWPTTAGWEAEQWTPVVQALLKAGPEFAVCAGVAATNLTLPIWELASGGDWQPRREVEAARFWLERDRDESGEFGRVASAAYAGSHDDNTLHRYGPKASAAGYAATFLLAFTESGAAGSPPVFDPDLLCECLAYAAYATSKEELVQVVQPAVVDMTLRSTTITEAARPSGNALG